MLHLEKAPVTEGTHESELSLHVHILAVIDAAYTQLRWGVHLQTFVQDLRR